MKGGEPKKNLDGQKSISQLPQEALNPIPKERRNKVAYNKINLELLEKPFPEEEVKQRNTYYGKILDYLEAPSVIKRLNQAFNGEWSFRIIDHKILDHEVVVLGSLRTGYITKQQFGTSKIHNNGKPEESSLGDDLKAASSDALKKCATMFGVGLYLYNNHNGKKLQNLNQTEEKPKDEAEQNPQNQEDDLPRNQPGSQPAEDHDPDDSPQEKKEEKKITSWQKNRIHQLIQEKRLSKERVYESIQKTFNKKLYQLSYDQAREVIQKLKDYQAW